ncbi:MAG: hypothetical protein P8N43_07320 [Alphaproteobacteria bacterium]|jgi:hypothetical protein|nr:hypothetical protein [Alphaproteobacteria bacterium]
MADHTNDPSGLPAAVAKAVGPERANKAGDAARLAISRLDRDNHWTQEPAHVYRAASWKASKREGEQ